MLLVNVFGLNSRETYRSKYKNVEPK
jgi:hypothetical protein